VQNIKLLKMFPQVQNIKLLQTDSGCAKY